MNRKPIEYTQYADTITKALEKGVFLTTHAEGKVNSIDTSEHVSYYGEIVAAYIIED